MSVDAKIRWMHAEVTLIAGVDMAKRIPWASLVDLKGLNIGNAFPFENNRQGFNRLLDTLMKAKLQTGATRVVVAIESTGHYWKPLARFLTGQRIVVVLVNAYHVKRTKETEDNTPAKTDRKDARLIANMAREGKFLTCMLPVGPYADLRLLSQARLDRVRKLNAAVNRLHALLDQFFPEFPGIFSKLTIQTPLLLLALCPFPVDVRKRPEDELFKELKEHGLRARKRSLHRLCQAAAGSIGITEGLPAARLLLDSIMAEIRFFRTEKDRLEQSMAAALAATGMGQFLLSIPGVGAISAAIFLGEVGDLTHYADWHQLRRLAGLNLVECSSGDHLGQKRISKRGRPYLRAILYQVCVGMVAKNKEFRAVFEYLTTRDHNQLKGKEAIIVLVSKLLRVMFELAVHRKSYDPALVLGPAREHQIATAA